MLGEVTQHLHTLPKRFLAWVAGVIFISAAIQALEVRAQNLVLRDTTVATMATFSANTITAGPNFTITSTGDVTMGAETIAIVPRFFVARGGKLQMISGNLPVRVETEDPALPDKFILFQNFPNPFNPETEIRFALTKESHVVIQIYNMFGQQIHTLTDRQYPPGLHSVHWNSKDQSGSSVPSGVYLYQIQAGEFSQVRKMILIR